MLSYKIIIILVICFLLTGCTITTPEHVIEPTEFASIEPAQPTDPSSSSTVEESVEPINSYTQEETSIPTVSDIEEFRIQYEDYKGAYRAIILDALEKWPRAISYQTLLGTLFDLNNDGQVELIMAYEEYDTVNAYYAIWTYDSGTPLLLTEEILAAEAGAGRGGLTVVTYDGETYLCVWDYNVDAGVNFKYSYNYKLFSINGYQLTQAHSFNFRFSYEPNETLTVVREDSVFKKDGVDIAYEEFEEVFSVLSNPDNELLSTLNISETTIPNRVGTPLEELLEVLGD